MTIQAAATEAYRRSPYPGLVHIRNHHDRLAVMARLAGMAPADVRTARVLEIGTGNGLNLLSLAQAYPDARFTGFDIEPGGIADGESLRVAAGLTNIHLAVLDLLDADGGLEEEYDYIIAHGVFAWVPAPVAEALLALIGHRLAPQGLAMISFNALPGCHVRQALRDMMLRAAEGCDDPDERLARGRAQLEAVVEAREHDDPTQSGFREAARIALNQDPRVLVHDELGTDWHPRYLSDTLAAAGRHGLAFLGDITAGKLTEAFVPEADAGPDAQRAVEQRACADDLASFCMFRRVVLIRAESVPRRVLAPATIATLYAASPADEAEPGLFVLGKDKVQVPYPALAAVLRRLIAAWPDRVSVSALDLAPELLAPLLSLYDHNIVMLHTVEAPFATEPGERPWTSPLARAMIARGDPHIATLAHRAMFLEPSVAAAVAALDGGGDESRFAAVIAEVGIDRAAALTNLAACAMLMR